MRPWRVVPVLVCLCLFPAATGVSLGIAGAAAARADDGLIVASTYSYTVDPAANAVRVVAEMTFTNTVPNRIDGNTINKTYFSGFSVPLPVEAVDIVATQDGAPLSLVPEFIDGTVNYFLENIDFADDLFYENIANVVLSYDIVGRQPRDDEITRVNSAYAAFTAYGIADAGNLTVRVVVPPGYVVDTFGDAAVQTDEDGSTVYTATDIEQPDEFNLLISARNDMGLTTEDRAVGDAHFVVRAWPDDPGWEEFVTGLLDQGVPVLEQLIGQPWPEDQPIEIREAVTSYLYGYAGWYNATNQILEIGEDLNPHTVVHELSHAWFNDNWFSERWISEGLAETYADLVNQQLGVAAVRPDPIDPAAPGSQPLNSWGNGSIGVDAGIEEDFGYNASWYVIDGIVDDIGADGMKRVLAGIESRQIPYAGDGGPEQLDAAGDWRRFLDLSEEVAGSASAAGLIEHYVVTPEEAPLLIERADARTAYDRLEAAGGEWAPPLTVRKLMSEWSFTEARDMIAESIAALAIRDELAAVLRDLGVAMDPSIERTFEAESVDLDDTIEILDATIAAADAVVTTRSDALAGLQRLGVEPTTEFDLSYHDETPTLAEIEVKLNDIIDATGTVGAAIDVETCSRSFSETVGLYGTQVDAILADAKAALANGDTELARAKAQQAVDTIDASGGVGRTRVLTAGSILAGLVLLIGLLAAVLRRRRRRHTEVVAAVPAATEATNTDTDTDTDTETDTETETDTDTETEKETDGRPVATDTF